MLIDRNLIINLILQDLKHNQLTLGLKNIGLDTDLHNLEIIEVVGSLMGLKEEEMSDQWVETYFSFLKQARQFPISYDSEKLKLLAEECYNLLLHCQNIERRIKNIDE